jgi:hypothetical protein
VRCNSELPEKPGPEISFELPSGREPNSRALLCQRHSRAHVGTTYPFLLDDRIRRMRLCRSVAYASAAIAGFWLCWHISIRAAESAALFNPDPRHVSNRLYRQLHVRTEPGGKEYGFDSLDPLLWNRTDYLLSGKSHAQAIALLDEFLRTQAERQISDALRRAVLQRDLWAVFDWADQPERPELPHQAERRELMAKLAPIVHRLALMPDELANLPDSYAHALQNHEFPASYDPASPTQAFLPPDLFDPCGPWVCLGIPGHDAALTREDLAAPLHDLSFTARSVFLVFSRLPAGRDATVAYFKQLAELKIPLFVTMQEPGWPQPMIVWNPQVPQFPIGTEFALVRKMVLPDRDGNLHLTRVTESVQIRHYTDIPNVNPMAGRDTMLARRFQEPSEIKLSRLLLFSDLHSGFRGATANDDSFLIFPAMTHDLDMIEDERTQARAQSPFRQCTSCHLGPGIQSIMSFSFRGSPSQGTVLSPRLAETTPGEESEKVLEWAQSQQKWKDLLQLWTSENRN